MRDSLLNWLKPSKVETVKDPIVQEVVKKPFVEFPCACGTQVKVFTHLMPGDAVVLNCENCDISWTVYSPSLIISKTKDITGDILQKQVWGELGR